MAWYPRLPCPRLWRASGAASSWSAASCPNRLKERHGLRKWLRHTKGTASPSAVTPTTPIQTIRESSTKLTCDDGKKKAKNCSKEYTFITILNLPNSHDDIVYEWRSNLSHNQESGHAVFLDNRKTLTKRVTLSCDKPSTFTLQLALIAPIQALSSTLTINHVCSEL